MHFLTRTKLFFIVEFHPCKGIPLALFTPRTYVLILVTAIHAADSDFKLPSFEPSSYLINWGGGENLTQNVSVPPFLQGPSIEAKLLTLLGSTV